MFQCPGPSSAPRMALRVPLLALRGARVSLAALRPLVPLMRPLSCFSPHHSLLPFLLDLGGGLLLANCLCHWLPEVRVGLTQGCRKCGAAGAMLPDKFFFIGQSVRKLTRCFVQ